MEMRVRNRTSQQQNERPLVRRGFTLVELLVAIVIISVLAAFLLPAIQGVIGTGKVAAVRNEISQLEAAIANFKSTYGIDPPSSIVLCEDHNVWNSYPASKAILQRLFPNFDFNLDINFDGNSTQNVIVLRGPECLVFFLGGIPTFSNGVDGQPGIAGVDDDGDSSIDNATELGAKNSDDAVSLTGFSKNPSNPFSALSGNETRQGPFFDFAPSRIRCGPANSGFCVYVDSLSGQLTPYYYLSSYDGRGYKRFGIDDKPGFANVDDDGDTKTDYDPMSPTPDADEINWTGSDDEYPSASFMVYLQPSGTVPYKQKSFQIISPGIDGEYGVGGTYDPSKSNSGLQNKSDYDNITNLSSGRLVP